MLFDKHKEWTKTLYLDKKKHGIQTYIPTLCRTHSFLSKFIFVCLFFAKNSFSYQTHHMSKRQKLVYLKNKEKKK
jgi:hypothetical protein